MNSRQLTMKDKVLGAHRDAVRYTGAGVIPATTVRRFMPGLKRQSHVTRMLNILVSEGRLAISASQGQLGYTMPSSATRGQVTA
ncbi:MULTISPECIES: hypothetical protein [Komagataeibacter]|uniref:hypothetical protein n=1 Tax=Komagataeibacter TaxID=1434011 RepID=UPI00104AE2E4|nr:hypothetical protein [Komagataeibacter saccharivorans]QBL93107.1 hypothetical protein KSAC_08660 [Komagataeibacter saccharivorans]